MDIVVDNQANDAFELMVDGHRAFAAYRLEGDTITFTHTVVRKAIAGRGVARTLIRAALDSARDRGLKVIAQCSFVAAYIKRHPDTPDLLA